MKVPWQINNVKIIATKHFALKYMRMWNWDFHDLREALRDAYATKQIGKTKYEVYTNKKGLKKIITAYYDSENEIICISGSSGGTPP